MPDLLDVDDWREEDAAWEQMQQEMLAALGTSDYPLATRCIARTSALAKAHFETGDPRLAASLACEAWLLQAERPSHASALFQEALAHWGQATAWLARQPPPDRPKRLARSSSFHLRLESKHPGAYQERQNEDMRPLLALGQTLTERLRGADCKPLAAGNLQAVSAPDLAFDTRRKVKTAVDLLRACSS